MKTKPGSTEEKTTLHVTLTKKNFNKFKKARKLVAVYLGGNPSNAEVLAEVCEAYIENSKKKQEEESEQEEVESQDE